MPKNHARKKALASFKNHLGVKHADAVALLDHPNPDEREMLVEYLETYVDINTYREAVDYLTQQKNDPRNQILCEKCDWLVGMVCPECPGCGCYNDQCSGWRHDEYQAEMDAATGVYGDYDDGVYCPECGAGGSGNPYEECTCYEDFDEDQEHEPAPVPGPELVELPSHGGWGSNSAPFPTSG
ncbi:hypothetical protein [Streptomyces sp. ME19-01-6]|uniref:hypothetical protein n=1 Tax=Streptomyces sp. ME19-01-6 TaxID=3028686 RepID=UPI0029B6BB8E|nr:hypothetical protein [Streptomyces sp. ME19-01-6]MDX3232856.1 hypothetical protein [Streptomyces sp. ME19-01-6]